MAVSAQRRPNRMTGDEFVAWMETWGDLEKWELHDGNPVAMTGGMDIHDAVAVNLTLSLAPVRKKGCHIRRDTLLRSQANEDFGAFPDLYVRCGPPVDRRTWLDDPVAIFEVLSRSTWSNDQGYKRQEYFKITTLKHYVVVYQTEVRIEFWSRQDDGEWPTAPDILIGLSATLHLSTFDLAIPMAEIYADTELAAASG